MGAENKGGGWYAIRLEKYGEAVLEHWEAMLTSMLRYQKESIFILPRSPVLAHPMYPWPNSSL